MWTYWTLQTSKKIKEKEENFNALCVGYNKRIQWKYKIDKLHLISVNKLFYTCPHMPMKTQEREK